MPNQHKHPPIAFRPPGPVRDRLAAFAAETGRAVNAIVTAAVVAYLDQGGTTPGTGGTTAQVEVPPPVVPPVVVPPRQPRAHKAAPVAAKERAEESCPHPKARIHKGLCGACGTWVGT